MLRHPDYTRARLKQLAERVRRKIYAAVEPVTDLWISPPVGRIPRAEALALEYRRAALGEQLGPLWTTFWVKARARVPAAWDGRRVDLLWCSHSEATLWIAGSIVQGLNHHPLAAAGSTRPDAVLATRAIGGEELSFEVEIACNGMFGKPEPSHRPYEHVSPFVLDRCELALFDEEAWRLYFDLLVLVELEAERDLDPTWSGELLASLNAVANVLDVDDRATWGDASARLRSLYARKNANAAHEVYAIGHAHIDTAWLWPIAETKRKCERTFSSQLAYMDVYPEHKFACSQAQQYAWIKDRQPAMWRRIVEKVRAGQWVPVGGSWVEPDCNLPSGESLVRQLLYGQRFFEREFGARCSELWLPDVFGYNAQLPQLMRLAGMTRFLTQKLSWNRFTKPEHQSFIWQGLDGSEVLAHFPPADTYNSNADVEELRRSARDFKDHDRSSISMMLFGHGDGGGGPTKRMLETIARAEDLQGVPKTRIAPPSEFFERLEASRDALHTIIGELYFEYHRGTYTTQAHTKRENRRAERALMDAELLAAVALRQEGRPYPSEKLERLWKIVLTNQFHDILPGSSITEVYEDAARDYEAVQAALRPVPVPVPVPVPINTIGFQRNEVVSRADGTLVFISCPPCGVGSIIDPPPSRATARREGDNFILENETLRAKISAAGDLTSLVLRGREALSAPGNILELYDDRPTAFDAWDIDPFHLETRRPCPPAHQATILDEGPLRAALRFERKLGEASTMTQTIRLDASSPILAFDCELDWQESETLLKVAFPINARAMHATYEMQFGVVERPTHFNTRKDLAQYEVPAHRFADLSEHGFGVALLSESKYGFSTYANTMRMSLVRAPLRPDPKADRGQHRFSYALYPHAGSWQDSGVVGEAARFNAPILWGHGAPGSFVDAGDTTLVFDGMKRAEDSDALVLRFYESCGGRGVAKVRVTLPFARAHFANLLEDVFAPARTDGGVIEVPYRPFEIITLVLD